MNRPFTATVLILHCCLSFFAQTKQSDREFDGLKGVVKAVLTERADATKVMGKLVETNRRKHTFVSYDPGGGKLAIQSYDYKTGELFHTMSYKVQDGEKVSFNEFIDRRKVASATSELAAKADVNRSDPRNIYQRKYTYKYDPNGNIIEESVWNGNGELHVRNVYTSGVRERQESGYRGDGTLNQKYSYTLDAKGNVVELAVHHPITNAILAKEKYEYLKFDKQGNWTKRVEWESYAGGRFVYELREVRYRTLTYF
jgi:hypothetical protein